MHLLEWKHFLFMHITYCALASLFLRVRDIFLLTNYTNNTQQNKKSIQSVNFMHIRIIPS